MTNERITIAEGMIEDLANGILEVVQNETGLTLVFRRHGFPLTLRVPLTYAEDLTQVQKLMGLYAWKQIFLNTLKSTFPLQILVEPLAI